MLVVANQYMPCHHPVEQCIIQAGQGCLKGSTQQCLSEGKPLRCTKLLATDGSYHVAAWLQHLVLTPETLVKVGAGLLGYLPKHMPSLRPSWVRCLPMSQPSGTEVSCLASSRW